MKPISTQNAPHYTWGDGCDGWHLVKTPALSVIQERVPPRAFEVRHLHRRSEQFFFVLGGTATLEIEGIVHTLGPGEGLHVPAGAAHQLKNDAEVELVFTVTSTPPSHGDRVVL